MLLYLCAKKETLCIWAKPKTRKLGTALKISFSFDLGGPIQTIQVNLPLTPHFLSVNQSTNELTNYEILLQRPPF